MSIEFGIIISSKDVTTASFSEIRRNEAYYEMENTVLWQNGETTSYIDFIDCNRDYTPSDGLWRIRTSDGRYHDCGIGLGDFQCKKTGRLEYELKNEFVIFELHIDPMVTWCYDAYINLPLSELSTTKAYSEGSSFIHPLYIDCHATCYIKPQYKIELSSIQSLILLYLIKKREFYNDYDLDILKSLEVILDKWKDVRSICQCTSNLLERKRNIIKEELYAFFRSEH